MGGGGVASWFHTNDARPHTLVLEGNMKQTYARLYDNGMKRCQTAVLPGWLRKHYDTVMGPSQSFNGNGCPDSSDEIAVTCAYTNLARSQSQGAVPAMVANGIAQANTVMANSGLRTRFYLRRNAFIPSFSSEYGNMTSLLHAVANPSDGHFDALHLWRGADRADLVALICGDHPGHGSVSGIGFAPATQAAFTQAAGFPVTEYTAIANLTLVHELGHNFGCVHDPANHSGVKIAPYAGGFNKKFCEVLVPFPRRNYLYSVMSYRPSPNCPFPWSCYTQRLPCFSGTNVNWLFSGGCGTHKIGSSTQRNNLVISDNAPAVANYFRDTIPRGLVIRTNSAGASITASVTDGSGQKNGTAPMNRTYCGDVTVTYTAAATSGQNTFKRWIVEGQGMPFGKRDVTVTTTNRALRLEPQYYIYQPGAFSQFGTGCRGTNSRVPLLTGLGQPDLNNPITLRVQAGRPSTNGLLTLGVSKTAWNTVPLPLDLGLIGATGCTLDVSLDVQFAIRTDSLGQSSTTMTVQNVPATIGQHFYWQATLFDAGAPRATKLVLTNAVDMLIGGRR